MRPANPLLRLAARLGLYHARGAVSPGAEPVRPIGLADLLRAPAPAPPADLTVQGEASPPNNQPAIHWEQRVQQAKQKIQQGDATGGLALLDGVAGAMDQLAARGGHCSALACLVMAEQLRMVSEAIGRSFSAPGWLRFAFYDGPPELPGRFVWQTTGPETSLLSVNRHLTSYKDAFFLLERLFSMLPVMARYRYQPEKILSSTVLHVADNGVSPGIAFCTRRDDVFLIPDGVFLRQFAYRATRDAYRNQPVDWTDRKPLGFWRGGTSGQMDRRIGWSSLPRIQLCKLGQLHPDMLDCGITKVGQMPDRKSVEEVEQSGLMKPFVPPSEFIQYKYQIDIDGNSNSWPGLFQKLQTGSPVVKIESPLGFRQWFYDRLKPWENYVSVASDMSDLLEKLHWLAIHDDEAQRIGARGRELADSLDYEGEIDRSMVAVAAAFHHASITAGSKPILGL